MMRAWWLFQESDTAICPTADATTRAVTEPAPFCALGEVPNIMVSVTGWILAYVSAGDYDRIMNRLLLLLTLFGLATSSSAKAEVIQSGGHGFSVSHSINTGAEPFVAYRTMTSHIDQWWDGSHSWSNDAANLYMKIELGGCFCERLPAGGRVEHLRIIYLSPGREIRFDGALGPLQQMAVQGRMIWKIDAAAEGSRISFNYHVHGFVPGGFDGLAAAVDGVIGDQLARLGQRLGSN